MKSYLVNKIYNVTLLIFVCVYTIKMNLGFIIDNDTFWHLLYGKMALLNWRFDRIDHWSYASEKTEWYYPGWFPEMLYYSTQRIFSFEFGGLILFVLFLMAVYVLGVFLIIKRKVSNNTLVAIITIGVTSISLSFWSARALIFTKVLLIYCILIYEQIRENPKWGHALGIGIINTLWLNSHADYFLIPILFSFFSLLMVVNYFSYRNRYGAIKQVTIMFLIVVLTFIGLVAFTPFGVDTVLRTISFYRSTALSLSENLIEWQPVDYQSLSFYAFFISFAILIIISAWKCLKKELTIEHLILLMLLCGLFFITMNIRRMIYYYAAFYPLVFSILLPKNIQTFSVDLDRKAKFVLLTIFIATTVFTTTNFVSALSTNYWGESFYERQDSPLSPYAGMKALKEDGYNLVGNGYNTFDNGAFIHYYFNDAFISMDSRLGVYSEKYFNEWFSVLKDETCFKYVPFFEKHNIQWVWISHQNNYYLDQCLIEAGQMKRVFQNELYSIFVK